LVRLARSKRHVTTVIAALAAAAADTTPIGKDSPSPLPSTIEATVICLINITGSATVNVSKTVGLTITVEAEAFATTD